MIETKTSQRILTFLDWSIASTLSCANKYSLLLIAAVRFLYILAGAISKYFMRELEFVYETNIFNLNYIYYLI